MTLDLVVICIFGRPSHRDRISQLKGQVVLGDRELVVLTCSNNELAPAVFANFTSYRVVEKAVVQTIHEQSLDAI